MVSRSKKPALPLQETTISDLPDDIIWQCLLRATYTTHCNVKAVCRNWNDVVSHPMFYKDRIASGKTDDLICIIQHINVPNQGNVNRVTVFDPVNGTWAMLPDIPADIGIACKCVSAKGKLVLIGGELPENGESIKKVYTYDFVSAKWRRGADMPTLRSASTFACSVSSSTGLVYVAGGLDNEYNCLLTAEAYNLEEDRWEILPPMNQELWHCHGVFFRGKFFVFSEYKKRAEIFDPNTGMWTTVDDIFDPNTGMRTTLDDMASPIVASGHLYAVTATRYDTEENDWFPETTKLVLMKYDTEINDWFLETSLPGNCFCNTVLTKFFPRRVVTEFFPRCVLTAEWRGQIFVILRCVICEKQVCSMFNPSTKRWVEVYIPEQFAALATLARSVVAVEI